MNFDEQYGFKQVRSIGGGYFLETVSEEIDYNTLKRKKKLRLLHGGKVVGDEFDITDETNYKDIKIADVKLTQEISKRISEHQEDLQSEEDLKKMIS